MSEVGAPEDFKLELDGPGVHPDTVDSAKLLALAAAYFEFLHKMASDDEMPIAFHGLALQDTFAPPRLKPDDPGYAKQLAASSASYLSGLQAPRGLGSLVGKVLDTLRAFPREYRAKVILGPRQQDLAIPETLQPSAFPVALETMRATVQRVGGAEPKVRLKGIFDLYSFSIDVTREQAKALAEHLYREVDIAIRVTRTGDGRVAFCELREFRPVSDEDPTKALQEWFRPHAEHWDNVSDIAEALGRRDR